MKFISEGVSLSDAEADDVKAITAWQQQKKPRESRKILLERSISAIEKRFGVFGSDIYLIAENINNIPIGLIVIYDIDWKNRNLFVEFVAIPNDNISHAIDAVVKFIFFELNIKKIYFSVPGFDRVLLDALKEKGFNNEGLLRGNFLWGFYRNIQH